MQQQFQIYSAVRFWKLESGQNRHEENGSVPQQMPRMNAPHLLAQYHLQQSIQINREPEPSQYMPKMAQACTGWWMEQDHFPKVALRWTPPGKWKTERPKNDLGQNCDTRAGADESTMGRGRTWDRNWYCSLKPHVPLVMKRNKLVSDVLGAFQ